MVKDEYRRCAEVMTELVICALNGEKPDADTVGSTDITALFTVCQDHSLTACAAYALESAGIRDPQFSQAKEKAIRKNILLDAERNKILARMEELQIWYMPLKGALLKDRYPRLGMRQMSDNDILYDIGRRADMRKIMEERGFRLKSGLAQVDEYRKEPVYNFEMHGALIMDAQNPVMADYYRDIRQKLRKDEGNRFGYHFSPEDYYIFMLAHEYKHFSDGGTGVRSLADTCVFLRAYGDSLDRGYVGAELRKLGLAEYEAQSRTLACKLFARQKLTESERELLEIYLVSGAYGTVERKTENRMQKATGGNRLKYIAKRIFPPAEHYKTWYPWAYRHKILLPAAWCYRIVKGIAKHRKEIAGECKYLHSKK